FVYSGLVPQSEFDSVAYANLVVDGAYVVPGDVCADPELGGDFSIFQTSGHQRDDSSLASAELPGAI
ncbi:MAG TPA: hypothetical protein VNZ03_03765, partial [Terriglobales bacterium]|nr:hypothetical protein [Terriglobales bacterium]